MKTTHPKIEVLKSSHSDNKTEPTPSVKPWQMQLVRFTFQTLGRVAPKTMAQQAYKIFATPRWRAKHTRTDAIIDSAKVSDFPFNDFTVKLYDWGQVGDPIILLAHGWESRGTALRMYVKPLLEKRYRVVAYDAVGHGDSSGERNNLVTNAKTITAIVHHFQGIYGAIGHSFGCSSLVYALQYVDNTLAIEKLIFLAVPHKTKKIMEGFFKMIDAPNSMKRAFYDHIEGINGRKIEDIDAAKAFSEVKVGELLLVHDRYDDVTSLDAAENVVHQWDNARLLITEGYGHFRLAKNPDVIKRIVDFIEN